MGLMDYHVYTGAWTVGKFPKYTYFLYHTDFYNDYGYNYVHGVESDGTPNHQLLNSLLESVYYADSFSDALAASKLAMGVFTEECVTIPLWSDRSYCAYNVDGSDAVLATVNMDGYGQVNPYTFMNAYKVSGEPLRFGLITPPTSGLNIMYSSWMYDYVLLDRIYTYGAFDYPPYNIGADQPGYVLDWYANTWVDPDDTQTKTMNYKKFRPDAYFIDTAGNQILPALTVDDYLFSNYVVYAIGLDSWHWDTVKDIKFFNKFNDTTVEIFYNARSYWFYEAASPPLLPRSVWLNTARARARYGLTENIIIPFTEGVDIFRDKPIGLGTQPNGPVWINSITGYSSGPLTEGVDYHWELGDWVIDTALVPGETVTVDYYAVDDASGYTLGDNNWEDVTVSCGMYYATGFQPGVGGFFTAKRNPFYYCGTPVLGEIDFVWESGGYYEVTIFDVVLAAVAYQSEGVWVPSKGWFPGADVALPGGWIDIFDIVTIASVYGQKSCP